MAFRLRNTSLAFYLTTWLESKSIEGGGLCKQVKQCFESGLQALFRNAKWMKNSTREFKFYLNNPMYKYHNTCTIRLEPEKRAKDFALCEQIRSSSDSGLCMSTKSFCFRSNGSIRSFK